LEDSEYIAEEIKLAKRLEDWCPEYVATGFIAECCGVSNATVLRWIAKGRLTAFRLPDGHYRIQREDLAGFLERYKIPGYRNASKRESSRSCA